MKSIAQFKRGDTFSLACTWKDEGVPTSVAGLTITSQLRTNGTLTLVASLTVIVGDQVVTPGAFVLVADSTSLWPVGALVCDIEVAQDEVIRSSESFLVPVTEGVTR